VDFMSGTDPTIFGKVFAQCSEYNDDDKIQKLPTNFDSTYKTVLMEHYHRCFPKEIPFENDINLMLVKHYS
jgi:hypothetical protein